MYINRLMLSSLVHYRLMLWWHPMVPPPIGPQGTPKGPQNRDLFYNWKSPMRGGCTGLTVFKNSWCWSGYLRWYGQQTDSSIRWWHLRGGPCLNITTIAPLCLIQKISVIINHSQKCTYESLNQSDFFFL